MSTYWSGVIAVPLREEPLRCASSISDEACVTWIAEAREQALLDARRALRRLVLGLGR